MKCLHFLGVGFFFLVCASCSTRLPVAGLKAYSTCDFSKAIEVFENKAKQNDKDYVLYQLALLSAALRAGYFEKAEKASLEAQRIMWSDAGKERGVASLVSAEAVKIFKGEPFEKSMASLYLGMIYFNRGDYDNARAAFSKAVLAIQQKQESHRNDFPLAHFLQSKVFLTLDQKDNARISLERAKKLYPNNQFFDLEAMAASNVLFIVELGRVPTKVETGPGGSLVDWKSRNDPEYYSQIVIDGQPKGWGSEAGNLFYEAKTKGHTGKDTVQASKGVAREISTITTIVAADEAARGNETAGWVALGAGLFSLANQSQADTRQWELLPDRFHVLLTKLEPGLHKIHVFFYDKRKQSLLNLSQSFDYNVPKENMDAIVLVRSSGCSPAERPKKTIH